MVLYLKAKVKVNFLYLGNYFNFIFEAAATIFDGQRSGFWLVFRKTITFGMEKK